MASADLTLELGGVSCEVLRTVLLGLGTCKVLGFR